jgi:hypothetical protein
VRALLKHLQAGIKYLEWAHSFVGSASICKTQAYRDNLSKAGGVVRQCAALARQAIADNEARKKEAAAAAGTRQQVSSVLDYAFAALRLLADKLDAVAGMNLLTVKTQGFNVTLRNLSNSSSAAHGASAAAAAIAAAAAAAAEGAAGGGGAGAMPAPAARARATRGRAPAAAAAAGGGGGGGGGLPGGLASVGESGTQNSASSAVELAPLAPDGGSSRQQDRLDLADGLTDCMRLVELWAQAAEQNEGFLRNTARCAAHAARAEAQRAAAAAAADGEGAAAPAPLLPGQCTAAALADAHRVGQLVLAVGFEAGMWDLPSVLDISRQAADAIGALVDEHAPTAQEVAT